jgi:predicted NAD/FAD-binding protein
MESFQFQKNLAILHCDQEIMPKSKKVWASWNFTAHKNSQENEEEKNSYNLKNTSFTYWMNNLQNIDKKYPLFITLNPLKTIDEKKIFAKFEYSHPLYNVNSFDFHRKIATIQGKNNMYFCGAYLGYGFHEDGLLSAINVAKMFDVSPPWQ